MAPNPIFPANRAELSALSPVSCLQSGERLERDNWKRINSHLLVLQSEFLGAGSRVLRFASRLPEGSGKSFRSCRI